MDNLEFKDNSNFRNDLKLEYLSILKSYDEKNTFDQVYRETATHIDSLIEDLQDVNALRGLGSIIDYEKTIINGKSLN